MMRAPILAAVALLLTGCQSAFTTVGSWSQQAPAPNLISGATVIPLNDGRAFALGGVQGSLGPVSQSLIFDPKTNRWSEAAALPEPRVGAAVVTLTDGTILVAGGVTPSFYGPAPLPPMASTWQYDPRRDAWRRAGALNTARAWASAARLTDGRVLLVGGSILRHPAVDLPNGQVDYYQEIGGSEIFDPVSHTWSTAGNLNRVRSSITLVGLPNGKALAAGGCTPEHAGGPTTSEPMANAELFDSTTRGWRAAAPLPSPRCGANAVLLPDGRAFVVGGSTLGSNGFVPAPGAVLFDPRTRSWATAGNSAGAGARFSMSGPAPVVLRDGSVFMPAQELGPAQGRVSTTVVGGQIYLPSENSWQFATTTSVRGPTSFSPPEEARTAGLPSGKALVLLGNVTLAFDPFKAPPASQALDNPRFTGALLALTVILGVLMVIGYLYQRRSRRSEVTL